VCLKVTATDADTGENARVQYRINSGDDLGAFDIDQDTGVLVLRGSLNYEVTTSYQLVIQAADSSAPATRLSAFATVIVTVTDINEFPPNFPVFMYIEKIMENLRPGTYVFGAHANDLDKGPFGIVQYSLIGADGMFQIDADSGDVTTLMTFNFMYEKSVQFKVKAMDRGALYHTVSVIVHILQQPVLGPQFTEKLYVFVTPGNGKKGDFVGQVSCWLLFLQCSIQYEHTRLQ
jgi:protocadherin-16/23